MVAPERSPEPISRAIDVLGYQVIVGAGMLDALAVVCQRVAPAHRYAIISDDQVAHHWLARADLALRSAIPRVAISTATVPAGESSKSREQWIRLTDWLLAEGAGRDTTVVALGGGVVGDLAGFVAATYLRGIPVIQVPTTLLAMVDASIGGKTGVDTPRGKNLVGAFHQPAAVVADPLTLSTLPAAHLRAGIAEVIKAGAIADAGLYRQAAAWGAAIHRALQREHSSHGVDWSDQPTLDIITRSVATKADVVNADPHERGRRQVLNAGHTVAHALERETGYALLHGEAVAIGLVIEAELGEAAGITQAGTAEQLRAALGSVGLPTGLPAGLDTDGLMDAMQADKKSRRGQLAFSLLQSIGAPAGSEDTVWSTVIDEMLVRKTLRAQNRGT